MALIVYDIALEMVADIKPVIDRVARHDRALANQMRRSASSVALNIGEAAYSRGRNEVARFADAMGSASETRAAMRVAHAWGWVAQKTMESSDCKLDRIVAMLWGLTRKKK